jgi:hypothetical protein
MDRPPGAEDDVPPLPTACRRTGVKRQSCNAKIPGRLCPLRGQTRPFALVEPHASFTLTSRHWPRQSSFPFWKIIASGRTAFVTPSPDGGGIRTPCFHGRRAEAEFPGAPTCSARAVGRLGACCGWVSIARARRAHPARALVAAGLGVYACSQMFPIRFPAAFPGNILARLYI